MDTEKTVTGIPLGEFCAWGYAIAWGASFYPTLYLNYKLGTADSISMDYIVLNIFGYISYSISICLQMFSADVRSQYQLAFEGKLPLLSGADLFYAFHGLALLSILLSQIVLGNSLWGFHNERVKFKIHKMSRAIILLLAISASVTCYLSDSSFRMLGLSLNLAYFKIIISLIKYIPQVVHNYHRKSMFGISKLQLSLDLTGSVLCIFEFFLKDGISVAEAIDANRGKFGITLVTSLFATIFMIQMYIYGTEDKGKKIKSEDFSEKNNIPHELV